MAQIYPSKQYTDFHKSTGEEIAYDELQDQLPDSYKIYHSEDWFRAMDQSNRDQPRGEIDFLVCHQEYGIFALEVKGGGIEYDPAKDQWWTINDEGRDDLDKSPAQQAQAGYYCLLERLKEHPKVEDEGTFSGVLGWGLFFPQMSPDRGLDLPDMTLPRERILFEDDREDLQESIENLYSFWDEQMSFTGPMDDSTWESINESFFRRKFRIMESLRSYVDRAEDVVYRLTEEQYELLDVFSRQNEIYIRGCAGSGKTLLSLEKARRLTAEGRDVLWLCYNEDLADDVRRRFSEHDFTINHFHSFAVKYLKEASLEIPFPNVVYDDPDDEDWQEFWSEIVPGLLEDAVDALDRRYDAIILDEAQDFKDNWYMALTDLFVEEGPRWFYVFYDPHQSIYGDLPDWLKESESDAFALDKNVRNTENIGRSALGIGAIDETVKFSHEGRPTRLSLAKNEDDLVDELRRALHEIFVEEELAPSSGVILARHKKENSPLADTNQLGNFSIVDDITSDDHSIQFSTIHSFKGLEADVVFLMVPEWDEEHAQAFYTGATRPKHLLWIFGADESLLNQLPEGFIEQA